MANFRRDRLPDPVSFFEGEGLRLVGRSIWRTTRCEFHGGSDSMRVNTTSGGWCCMSCGERGGDAVAYLMARDGLDFADAAKRLGAWDNTGPHDPRPERPRLLGCREALSLIATDLLVLVVVLSDVRQGVLPSEGDWLAFLERVGRIERLAVEFAS
jgi:hypothetical protein